MKNIWIVNDKLTCIKNAHTHWHELLELSNKCKDKTSNIGSFRFLRWTISFNLFCTLKKPKFIVRNCTFFGRFPFLPKNVKVISILQDFYSDDFFTKNQLPVIEQSYRVVCVSKFMYDKAYSLILDQTTKNKLILINNGVDENFWKSKIARNRQPLTICFIGEDNQFKNVTMLKRIIENTKYNYVLIMRDPMDVFSYNNPRVTIFKNISSTEVRNVIDKYADAAICTSDNRETFHLSGIQMLMMNKPIATTYVAIYKNFSKLNYNINTFGVFFDENNAIEQVNKMMEKIKDNIFFPREFLLNFEGGGLTRNYNNDMWKKILEIQVLK